MIRSLKNGSWTEQQDLFTALNLKEREWISVVGAGGKTTTIRTLQEEYRKRGICHAVSTTTHMQYEQNESFLEKESLESFFQVYDLCKTAWIGTPVAKGKMKGPSFAFLGDLFAHDVSLLIEADGAKGFSCKVPAAHEPVILQDTTMVLEVCGMDALGKRICDAGFRQEDVGAFLGKKKDDLLTVEDLVEITVSRLAGKKGVPQTSRFQVILNKCDLLEDAFYAELAAEQIAEHGVEAVHLLYRNKE